MMSTLPAFFLALSLFAFAPATLFAQGDAAADYRTYSNSSGKTIRAKITDKKGGIAHLRMTDGITYRVAIDTLSQSDREFIDSWEPAHSKAEKLRAVDMGELFAARGFKGVPLILKNNQALLDIKVGGQSFTCLLDTGAQSSVIDRTKAKALRLTVRENVGFAGGIGGSAGAVGMTNMAEIKVGEVKKRDVTFAVMDLRGVSGGHGSTRFDGFIGFDLLEDLEAVIDYKGGVLYLREDG
jgi:hypothetical protein